MIIGDYILYKREARALQRWHEEKKFCRHPLHTNIWHRTQNSVRVSHAFYMNDERNLDPFYLEYDR